MTKRDLVRTIAEETGVAQEQIQEIVQKALDGIIRALADEGRVELRDFGVFEVRKRKATRARNPRTGVPVDLPARLVVTFRQGREMELQIGRPTETPDDPGRS